MKYWTKKELQFLKKNYKNLSYVEISKILNRTMGGIYWKAFELKLNKGRWNGNNRLNKEKVINLLIDQKNKHGKNFSLYKIPISLRSACQRHFRNFNNAKKAANLEIREYIKSLPKEAYKPSKELAYIIGLLLGDGSFRYQKSKDRTSYVIIFSSKDKDLMDYFIKTFKTWSNFKPKISIIKEGYRKFPGGHTSFYHETYNSQIGFKTAWIFLKQFQNNPKYCIKFFPEKYYKWLIKGLWDAEGCIRTNNQNLRIHFSNSNLEILELYKNLLKNYDFNYKIESSNKNKNVNITISDNFNVIKFIKLIRGITIKRKENKEIMDRLNRINEEYKKLDMSSTFQKQVYELAKQIPSGYVSTYSEIAYSLGTKAYRAVGNAMRKNPIPPIVPCHRVIKSDGSIGGFGGETKGPKIKKKIFMLKKEGIKIKNKKINLKKYLYKFKNVRR